MVAVLAGICRLPGPRSFAGGALGAPSGLRSAALTPSTRSIRVRLAAESGGFLPLEVFGPAVNGYFASSPPLFQEMKDSLVELPFTFHWAHAVGGTLLFLYAAYGIFLGWQIRWGNGSTVYPLAYDQTAAERHPAMMTYVLFFLVLEIPDGLTLLAANEQPLLKSTHASTAVVGLVLMAIVAAIGGTMKGSQAGRTAHAYLGTATVLALIIHAYFGLALGWSF